MGNENQALDAGFARFFMSYMVGICSSKDRMLLVIMKEDVELLTIVVLLSAYLTTCKLLYLLRLLNVLCLHHSVYMEEIWLQSSEQMRILEH